MANDQTADCNMVRILYNRQCKIQLNLGDFIAIVWYINTILFRKTSLNSHLAGGLQAYFSIYCSQLLLLLSRSRLGCIAKAGPSPLLYNNGPGQGSRLGLRVYVLHADGEISERVLAHFSLVTILIDF